MKHGLWITCSLLFLAGLGAAPGQTVLLDDVFTEASRSAAANLPTSTPWYYGGTSGSNLAITGGALHWNTVSATAPVVGYFNSQTLGVGDSITLSFTFTATGIANIDYGLRLGLFASGGTKVAADGVDTTSFPGYKGFGAYDNLGSATTANAPVLFHRVASSNTNLLGNSAPTTEGSTGAAANLTSGTSYTGTLTILNNGGSETLTYSLGGTSLSYTDSSVSFTSFDTVAFQVTNTQANAVNFSEIKVTYNAVPEPSPLALGLAAGGVLLAGGSLWRRRRFDAV